MFKSVLKTFILIVAVIGGAVGASFVKSSIGSAPAVVDSAHDKSKDDHGDNSHKKEKKKQKKESKSKGGHGEAVKSDKVDYLKFKRQFVIPVMNDKKIDSLLIMNFNLELNEDAPSDSFQLEPKFRDAFMRDLLELSNQGLFSDDLTSPKTFEIIRETLLGSSRRIMEEGVENVLILDIVRRDSEL